MLLSTTIKGLMDSPLVWKPGQRKADPAVLRQLEEMYQTARKLEILMGRKSPSGIEVRPIMLGRPVPVNPQWAAALAVHGD